MSRCDGIVLPVVKLGHDILEGEPSFQELCSGQ